MIDKFKTGDVLSKNAPEKLNMLQIKVENINAINAKNLVNVDNIIEKSKGIFKGIENLKGFELTLNIDKSVPLIVQTSRKFITI